MEHEGFRLWVKCHQGDKDALKRMNEYNINDVLINEELYYLLRPYLTHKFNLALYNDIEAYQCPVCGSTKLESIGYYYTPAGKYEALRCQDCGCTSRKKDNKLSKQKKKLLLVNS